MKKKKPFSCKDCGGYPCYGSVDCYNCNYYKEKDNVKKIKR